MSESKVQRLRPVEQYTFIRPKRVFIRCKKMWCQIVTIDSESVLMILMTHQAIKSHNVDQHQTINVNLVCPLHNA